MIDRFSGRRYHRFNLENTSYTLVPEGKGARLVLVVGTRVMTNFNWYAGFWARFLVDDTARAILFFYKNRSEAPSAWATEDPKAGLAPVNQR